MNCDVCQKDSASIFLTQIVDGKMQKVNLCESCAKEKGVTDPTGFALADLLKGVGTETVSPKPTVKGELKCHNCGFTETEFKKTGRLGCSQCYEVLSEGLDNLLEAMHRSTVHKGKVPMRYRANKEYRDRLADLQTHLQDSVDAENYEEAARLRDAISELKDEYSSKKNLSSSSD